MKLKPRSRRRRDAQGLPALFLLTDGDRLPDPLAAIARLPRDAGVIFRHYGVADRPSRARELARFCRRRGLTFLVAGDAALARRVGADGVHLPEHMLARAVPRYNPRWIVTAACHSLPAAMKARTRGVDAVLISPVFATRSHPEARPLGPRRLAQWIRALGLPVYALGGVNTRTAGKLKATGITGIAAIEGLTRQSAIRNSPCC